MEQSVIEGLGFVSLVFALFGWAVFVTERHARHTDALASDSAPPSHVRRLEVASLPAADALAIAPEDGSPDLAA